MSPVNWDSTSGEEGEYLMPRESPPTLPKNHTTPHSTIPLVMPNVSTPLSPPSRIKLHKKEDELRNWTGAGTRIDD